MMPTVVKEGRPGATWIGSIVGQTRRSVDARTVRTAADERPKLSGEDHEMSMMLLTYKAESRTRPILP